MSSFTKKGLSLKEGDKVKWDGLPSIVVAVAEEDVECPYRVFSEKHEISGWVSGEVLVLVETANYEAPVVELLRVGDFVETSDGKGVVLRVDSYDVDQPYRVGVFNSGDEYEWHSENEVTFLSRPDYGMEV